MLCRIRRVIIIFFAVAIFWIIVTVIYANILQLLTSPYVSNSGILEEIETRSILGRWLLAPEGTSPPKHNSAVIPGHKFIILMWKRGPFLEKRHIRRYLDGNPWPFGECSVRNCVLSYRDEEIEYADAVIFHLQTMKGLEGMPARRGKNGQIWIFMTDESPIHTFLYGVTDTSVYNNMFDWSMTYRRDSDVPIAYGRTTLRQFPLSKNDSMRGVESRKEKSKLVAILGSNCFPGENHRWDYVQELKSLLRDKLDIFGQCLDGNKTACPGHFHDDCPILKEYKFYLAFENSNCRDYVTEKPFWHAYEKESVPVIMGAPRIDCERILPPGSFLHVDDYSTPHDLASHLLFLDEDRDAYEEYHSWRDTHVVINEHGYFGTASKHYCRVCEALNYNDRPITKYKNFGRFWNATTDCYPYMSEINIER